MKSILSFLSAIIACGTGCQPTAVAPPAPNPVAKPAESTAASAVIWVAVDDPGESKSPQEIFQIAAQRVIPNLKKLPGAKDVQIVGSEKQLAMAYDLPSVIIKVSLPPDESSLGEFRQAFPKMESLPVAVSTVLDETTDSILTVEMRLPPGTTLERTRQTAIQATELVSDLPNVDATVTYFDAVKSDIATILVKQTSARPTTEEVTQALAELSGVQCVVTGK